MSSPRTTASCCCRPGSTRSTSRWRRPGSATSSRAGGAPPSARARDDGDVEEPVFSGEESPAPTASAAAAAAVDALALGAARRAEAEALTAESAEPAAEDAPLRARRGRDRGRCERADGGRRLGAAGAGGVARGHERMGHLVAIDADLSSLEWLKASLDGLCRRVHIFQHRDAAFDRIRQYLTRGIVPTVVLSDADGSRRGPRAASFVRRLRAIAPAMPILALRPEHAGDRAPDGMDGVVFRPNSPTADPKRWHLYRALATRLRSELEPWLRGEHKVSARRRAQGALARLKGASERLRDPSTQGEVLTLVLDFAAETFARVAMFMVRDDVAVGMAQRGLPPTGGPDDARMRAIELGPDAMPELFEEVLTRRARAPRGDPRAARSRARDAARCGRPAGGLRGSDRERRARRGAGLRGQPPGRKAASGPDRVRDRAARGGPRARSRAARARARGARVERGPVAPRARTRAVAKARKSAPRLKKSAPERRYRARAREADSIAGGGAVPRILIVEDSPTMRSLLTSSLEELEGAVKIVEVGSGFEALRHLPRERFDLIVTDINMPDINGLELVSFVKNNAAYRDIPLVIVSTERSERDRDKGLGLGADAYLVKPFEPEALRDIARRLLEGAE